MPHFQTAFFDAVFPTENSNKQNYAGYALHTLRMFRLFKQQQQKGIKNMKIIGLYNKQSSGKTTTLDLVIDKLQKPEYGYKLVPEKKPNTKDKRVLLQSKKLKICITTFGDNGAEVEKNIDFFKIHQPNIAISAARTKGKTRKLLDDYAESQGTKVILLKKQRAENEKERSTLNEKDADLILTYILSKDN